MKLDYCEVRVHSYNRFVCGVPLCALTSKSKRELLEIFWVVVGVDQDIRRAFLCACLGVEYLFPFMLVVDIHRSVLPDHGILFMIREELVLSDLNATFYDRVSPCWYDGLVWKFTFGFI